MSLVTALLFNKPPPTFDGTIRRHFLLDEEERRFLGKEHKEPIEFRNTTKEGMKNAAEL